MHEMQLEELKEKKDNGKFNKKIGKREKIKR